MAEKKAKPANQNKIEIKTREPKKRDIFANLGRDRDKSFHPVREILDFPSRAEETEHKSLDSQRQNDVLSDEKIIGYPNNEKLDSQTINPGYPADEKLDSLIAKKGVWIAKDSEGLDSNISKSKNLDSQKSEKAGKWKKYEKKRKGKGIFLRTEDVLTKKFKQFCIEKGWDFSYATELAWNKLMTDLAIQTDTDLDSLIALDDRRLKMLFKTKPSIINLYLRYNSIFNELSGAIGKGKWAAKWSPRDDEAAGKYNDIPTAVVELGIIHTQLNKGIGAGKIQTFRYYIDEIEKVLISGVSDEMLETILQYHRQMWKNTTHREVDSEIF